ncbi:TPA_asm: DUF1642 domain-containing protein [Listeria monocytogenes]|nr:DUF1642 domain-containing protein [Listeria monocytogenes]
MKFKECDKPQQEYLYYVRLPALGYLTNEFGDELTIHKSKAAKFTKSEIMQKIDTRYWAFAVPVEEGDETK